MDRNPFELAIVAGCGTPASLDSAGAKFLVRVAESLAELEERTADGSEHPADVIHEIADRSVPVYSGEVWDTFVDLAAWKEQLEAWDEGLIDGRPEHSDQHAQVALYLIAERLLYGLR